MSWGGVNLSHRVYRLVAALKVGHENENKDTSGKQKKTLGGSKCRGTVYAAPKK